MFSHCVFQWEEVVSQKAQLEEERQAAATAEANRRVFLSQEEEETKQHRDNLRRSQDHSLSQQWEMRARSPCSTSGLLHNPVASPGQSQQRHSPNNICLNNQSTSDDSTCFSLDRGRGELDCRERELMQDIRELRQKLAARGKNSNSTTSQ